LQVFGIQEGRRHGYFPLEGDSLIVSLGGWGDGGMGGLIYRDSN
jgi:hypothetical protein